MHNSNFIIYARYTTLELIFFSYRVKAFTISNNAIYSDISVTLCQLFTGGFMISVYLESISTFIEGEDLVVKYAIYDENDALIKKDRVFLDSVKPLVADHSALFFVIDKLVPYKKQDEIVVFINNPSLFEQLNGTSTIQKKDSKNMTVNILRKLEKLRISISVEDVSTSKEAIAEWNSKLSVCDL